MEDEQEQGEQEERADDAQREREFGVEAGRRRAHGFKWRSGSEVGRLVLKPLRLSAADALSGALGTTRPAV